MNQSTLPAACAVLSSVLGLAPLLVAANPASDETLSVIRHADTLTIELRGPVPAGGLSLCIHSDRNTRVARFSDDAF